MKKDLRNLTQFDIAYIKHNHYWIFPQALATIASLPLVSTSPSDLSNGTMSGGIGSSVGSSGSSTSSVDSNGTMSGSSDSSVASNGLGSDHSKILVGGGFFHSNLGAEPLQLKIYDGEATLKHWSTLDLPPHYDLALQILTHSPRSDLVPSPQANLTYNQSVPLVLSAFKSFRNLGYDRWVSPILEPLHQECWRLKGKSFQVGELSEALIVRTGRSQGTSRVPTAYFKFPKSWGGEPFQSLNYVTQHLYCSTWLFHPSILHPNSIQGFNSWDTISPKAQLFK